MGYKGFEYNQPYWLVHYDTPEQAVAPEVYASYDYARISTKRETTAEPMAQKIFLAPDSTESRVKIKMAWGHWASSGWLWFCATGKSWIYLVREADAAYWELDGPLGADNYYRIWTPIASSLETNLTYQRSGTPWLYLARMPEDTRQNSFFYWKLIPAS